MRKGEGKRLPPGTPLATRLWSYTALRQFGCWEWLRNRNNKGYGQLNVGKNKMMLVHRLAWELVNGPIPVGLYVLHRCDNPGCLRPDHLFLGTAQDNMDDKDAKGRLPRGERHCRSKISDAVVAWIRAQFVAGVSCRVIAAEANISPSYCYAIRNGVWRKRPMAPLV